MAYGCLSTVVVQKRTGQLLYVCGAGIEVMACSFYGKNMLGEGDLSV